MICVRLAFLGDRDAHALILGVAKELPDRGAASIRGILPLIGLASFHVIIVHTKNIGVKTFSLETEDFVCTLYAWQLSGEGRRSRHPQRSSKGSTYGLARKRKWRSSWRLITLTRNSPFGSGFNSIEPRARSWAVGRKPSQR